MLRRTLLALCVCVAASAHASIFDIYGFNARALGMGGALTAPVDDWTATFYNPAAITRQKRVTFGAGFMLTVPELSVGRSVPICLDAPSACTALYGATWSDRDTVLPGTFSGVTLGWVIPFGGIFDNHLAFAFAVYLPTVNIVRAEALDPQTPQFYMYQNLPDQLVILASLAYEPLDWLSLGFGIQVLANVYGTASFDLDVVNGTLNRQDINVELRPKAAVTGGMHIEPMHGLRIGVTYRQAIGLEFGLPADIDVGEVAGLQLDVKGRVLYSPHQINTGVSWSFDRPKLTLSAEVDVALWSQAPDPSPRVAVDFKGKLLDAFGLQDAIDVATEAPPVELHFKDTVSPRIGVEWAPAEWVKLRGGYFYRPSPAPRASGPNSYLDNDVHGFAFGAAFIYDDPLGVHRKPVSLEIGNQFGWLPSRTVYKDNVNDPVGDLQHGGFTYSLGVSVNHSY